MKFMKRSFGEFHKFHIKIKENVTLSLTHHNTSSRVFCNVVIRFLYLSLKNRAYTPKQNIQNRVIRRFKSFS